MSVTVIQPSGSPKDVPVRAVPTLTVDAEGELLVTYLSEEGDTVTAGFFDRGEWSEAWYQPAGTSYRLQHVTADHR